MNRPHRLPPVRRLSAGLLIAAAAAWPGVSPGKAVAQSPPSRGTDVPVAPVERSTPPAPPSTQDPTPPPAPPAGPLPTVPPQQVKGMGLIFAATAEVKAKADGVVQSVHVQEGQAVKAGQHLWQLDDRPARARLEGAEADLMAAKARFERVKRQAEAAPDKPAGGAEVEEGAANVRAAEAVVTARQLDLDATRATAPMDGVVSSCEARPGDVVTRGLPLCTLIESASPKVTFDVPVGDVTRLRPGMKVRVAVPALDRTFDGEVYFVAPEVNPAAGTIAAKARIAGPDPDLKPGMQAEVTVQSREAVR